MKKKTLDIPDIQSLMDIKYKDFKKFQDILGLQDGDSDEFIMYKMVDIFYGIKKDDARKLTPEQFELLVGKVTTAIAQPTKLTTTFKYNGVTYGLIPNFEKITAGELIDLDTLFKEKNLIQLMSILYRPIVGEINNRGEYRIEEYKGFTNVFEDIPAYYVEGVLSFFFKSFQILSQRILTSMANQKTKEMMKIME